MQNLDNLFAVMAWWNPGRSATAATATSAETRAAIVPTKQRANGANCNLVKPAGVECFHLLMRSFKCGYRCGPVVNLWFLVCDCNPVPAKGRAARERAHLKAPMKGADWTLTVPKRASAMVPLRCVLPPSQRRTSPPAILIPKFASAGYVGRCTSVVLY